MENHGGDQSTAHARTVSLRHVRNKRWPRQLAPGLRSAREFFTVRCTARVRVRVWRLRAGACMERSGDGGRAGAGEANKRPTK